MQTNDDAQPKAEENGGAEDLAAMTEIDTIPVEYPPPHLQTRIVINGNARHVHS